MFNYENWTTLKTANKVAFKKIAAVDTIPATFNDDGSIKTTEISGTPSYTVLEKKVYNPDTGVESTKDFEMSLSELEREKARKTAEKAALTTEIAEIGKMITQIKKV